MAGCKKMFLLTLLRPKKIQMLRAMLSFAIALGIILSANEDNSTALKIHTAASAIQETVHEDDCSTATS
jgi:urease alpha subunit